MNRYEHLLLAIKQLVLIVFSLIDAAIIDPYTNGRNAHAPILQWIDRNDETFMSIKHAIEIETEA